MNRVRILRRSVPPFVFAIALLAWTGCSSRANLKPVPSAKAIAPDTGIAVNNNVTLRAEAGAWSGNPVDLANRYTPMKLVIHNGGSEPVSLRYSEFVMIGSDGSQYHAIPPLNVSGSVHETSKHPIAMTYPATGFDIAPYYGGFYPGYAIYDGAFAWDAGYAGSYYPQWKVKLPTQDMLNKALPEGVLKAGGTVTGFVYFQKIPKDIDRVKLQADFKGPQTAQELAQLTIPFNVD